MNEERLVDEVYLGKKRTGKKREISSRRKRYSPEKH